MIPLLYYVLQYILIHFRENSNKNIKRTNSYRTIYDKKLQYFTTLFLHIVVAIRAIQHIVSFSVSLSL